MPDFVIPHLIGLYLVWMESVLESVVNVMNYVLENIMINVLTPSEMLLRYPDAQPPSHVPSIQDRLTVVPESF